MHLRLLRATLTDKFSTLAWVLTIGAVHWSVVGAPTSSKVDDSTLFDEVYVLFTVDTASVEGDVATLSGVLSEVIAEKSSP